MLKTVIFHLLTVESRLKRSPDKVPMDILKLSPLNMPCGDDLVLSNRVSSASLISHAWCLGAGSFFVIMGYSWAAFDRNMYWEWKIQNKWCSLFGFLGAWKCPYLTNSCRGKDAGLKIVVVLVNIYSKCAQYHRIYSNTS